ncbi:MAG: hypothetical protein HUK18_00865 [Bacteroidales bacterium]|mgnify:CR=1 FL=1|nr:hypothetical protein [Bacteroidales bacterium]
MSNLMSINELMTHCATNLIEVLNEKEILVNNQPNPEIFTTKRSVSVLIALLYEYLHQTDKTGFKYTTGIQWKKFLAFFNLLGDNPQKAIKCYSGAWHDNHSTSNTTRMVVDLLSDALNCRFEIEGNDIEIYPRKK